MITTEEIEVGTYWFKNSHGQIIQRTVISIDPDKKKLKFSKPNGEIFEASINTFLRVCRLYSISEAEAKEGPNHV